MTSKNSQGERNGEAGQILVLFALGLVAFLGFVGMSIDIGRLVWARTQLQAAVDAASVAGAQSLPSTSDATAKAQQYFDANKPSIVANSTSVTFATSYASGAKVVTATATAHVPTWFAKFFGVDEWVITVDADAESLVIDAMLVLDRSGSMCWDSSGPNGQYVAQVRLTSNINSSQTSFVVTKDASSTPLNTLVWVGQRFRLESSSNTEWLEITAINNSTNTLTVLRNRSNPNGGGPYGASSHNSGRRLRGDTCQQAAKAPYYPFEYIKNGGNVFVNQLNSTYDRIGYVHFATRGGLSTTFTTNFATLHTYISGTPDPNKPSGSAANGDSGDGSTNIAHGMWMANQQLVTNARANAKRVMVLLSDGVANRYCTGTYSTACSSTGTNTGTAASHAQAQADYAAANAITIYTISYGDSADDDLMASIAATTGGVFYKAPDEASLIAAFVSIGQQTNLRIKR